MDTCYITTNSFFKVYHFNYDKYIIAIKFVYNYDNNHTDSKCLMAKYDCQLNIFSDYLEINKIENPINLTYFSGFLCTGVSELYLFDCIYNLYVVCRFPYEISEIDGNYITSCLMDVCIYIFHSSTERYNTGVFVYSIKNNTFNCLDFKNKKEKSQFPIHTNRFNSLHGLDIISCYTAKGELYILYTNHDVDVNIYNIGIYDVENDKLKDVICDIKEGEMLVNSSIIFILPTYTLSNEIYIYDNVRNDKIIFNDKKYIVHCHMVDNTLFVLRGNLQGLEMEIKIINISNDFLASLQS